MIDIRKKQEKGKCAKLLEEVEENQSLVLIENALWSMKSIILNDERMTKKNRANFDLLFKVTMPRVENLMKILNEDIQKYEF